MIYFSRVLEGILLPPLSVCVASVRKTDVVVDGPWRFQVCVCLICTVCREFMVEGHKSYSSDNRIKTFFYTSPRGRSQRAILRNFPMKYKNGRIDHGGTGKRGGPKSVATASKVVFVVFVITTLLFLVLIQVIVVLLPYCCQDYYG